MSNPWLRLYVELLDDPKVQRLPPALFKLWINLLCVAARCAGVLPATSDLAFMLRAAPDSLAGSVAELLAGGLLDETPDGLRPHNWDRRQYRSDNSTARVRQHRDKLRNVSRNVSVKRHETVTETPSEAEQSRAESEAKPLSNPLLKECLAAIGRESSTMPPAMANTAAIEVWLAGGCDLVLDVLPALRAKGTTLGGGRARTWQWFERAVFERREKRQRTTPTGDPVYLRASDPARAAVAARHPDLKRPLPHRGQIEDGNYVDRAWLDAAASAGVLAPLVGDVAQVGG